MTKNDIPAGTTFGQLTVLARTDRRSGYNRYFLCRCTCGREVEIQGTHMLHHGQISCGCISHYAHGRSRDNRRLRQAWRHMISRCTNPTDKDFCHYGARGISICTEWLNDFDNFRDWALANGYLDTKSLDRIVNDGNYTPANCRWATITEQNRNTRRVLFFTLNGETKPLSMWAEDPRCRVSYSTLHQRITTLGWGFEAALLNRKHERPRSRANISPGGHRPDVWIDSAAFSTLGLPAGASLPHQPPQDEHTAAS